MTAVQHFVYKLTPPRPTFAFDQTPDEAQVMADHVEYWRGLLDRGIAVAFGPVLDPAGGWGLAVAEVENAEQAEQLRAEDPVTRAGIATLEVHPMLSAFVRPPTATPATRGEGRPMFFSVHTMDGDPHALLAAKREHLDAVVTRLAPQHGAVASVTVPTSDGITVYNLWRDSDGAAAFTGEPDAQAAQRASGLPAPSSFARYPVADASVY